MPEFVTDSAGPADTTLYSGEYPYPDWVRGVASTGCELTALDDPEATELWQSPEQSKPKCRCSGYSVLGRLMHDHLIRSAIAYGDLCHMAEHSHTVPAAWRGLIVYAWASIVDNTDYTFFVPGLDCRKRAPHITWTELGEQWGAHMPAALRRLHT